MPGLAIHLPEDVIAVRDGIEAFVKAEILPRHEKHADLFSDQRRLFDDDGRYSQETFQLIREVRMASAKAGFFNMCVPENLGGAGLGILAYYIAWETVFRLCGGHHWLAVYAISHWAFGPSRVLEHMSDWGKENVLPDLISGEKSMCFGLSEPGAGSDVARLTTKATADGEGWRINGRKIWTTNSPHAEYCLLFAITDPERAVNRKGGISAFLVPTDSEGFQIESIIKMFGHYGGDEGSLVFEDLRVEPEMLVGEMHEGFKLAIYGVSLGRIYNSARSVGLAQWALHMALDHTGTRESFGQTINQYQGVTFPLAESFTDLHAANLMAINAAMLVDGGDPAIKELSMAKAFAVQAGVRAIDRAMQTHGAMGFTNELGLTEAWHTVRSVNVADGTNEILNRTIVHRLLNGDTTI